MELNKYLKLSPEVAEALAAGKPIVALESTIISHGMPYPQNVETAYACERVCRENGAVPATCAIIGGKLCAGLTAEEIDYLGREGKKVTKARHHRGRHHDHRPYGRDQGLRHRRHRRRASQRPGYHGRER